MVEKKFVVDGMKLSYNGPFDIIEFYKKVDEWISSKGKEKEIKKKTEHVEPKGKNIEWFIEIWEDVAEYARPIVRMRALFKDVREIEVAKGSSRIRVNQASVLIIFDGILETDIEGKWHQKPLFYFTRALFDKYIWKFHTNRFEAALIKETYDMHKTLQDFFNRYKY